MTASFEPPAAPPPVEELFEHAPCGLVVTRHDGLILRVNATFRTWVGHAEHELVGVCTLQDLFTMGGRIFHQTHWAPLLQIQGSVSEVKLEVRCSDGRTVPMVLNAVRREHSGAVLHEVAVFLATDRHRYEQELMLARRKAEELLERERATRAELAITQDRLSAALQLSEDRARLSEQMIGIVSHDLRNPLSTISLSAQLLRKLGLEATGGRVVERILAATGRANRLIADLLDWTRTRLGRGLRMELAEYDGHALVRDALDELGSAFPGRALLHRTTGEGLVVIDGDRLAQLVGNLVANAMAYGAPGRPVTVESAVNPGDFVVTVHNEGHPIPAALRATLFEPMTRGELPGPDGRSVGLGLFIVREIALTHGGGVDVLSDEADGTRFVVHFPRGGPAPAASTCPASDRPG